MKNILITGGAGFIGSHLCEFLLKKGERVTVVDNFFSSSPQNINIFLNESRFSLIRRDIAEPLSFDAKFDEIYNLACPASPVWYQKDPLFTLRSSTVGVFNVLELARKNNATILHASTSEIYGDPEVHPQPESYWGNVNPVGLRSCYDEGKRCAETLCIDFNRQHGVPVKIVRIFNTYGPRMATNDGRVVSNFIVQALKGDPITVYGSGSQTRSFQYISDLIDGLVAMMRTDKSFSGPLNLGNPNEFTILELARKVIQLTNSKSRILFEKLPSDDPRQRKPVITLAQNNLKWSPKVDLEEGLKLTIEHFRKYLSCAGSDL